MAHHCKSCGHDGTGKFCNNCGQSYSVKRVTLKGLLHDVFHFFTHLEKGFGYTLKRLVTAPGDMQREYLEGVRSRYQKPFSMFFICASANALLRYWMEELRMKYFEGGAEAVASFRHEYQLMLLVGIVPLLIFFTWLFFRKSPYNFAETGVLQLYMLCFILIATIIIGWLQFFSSGIDTAYIELPLFAVYCVVTNIRFYNKSNPWIVGIKTLVLTILFFMMIQYMEDFIVDIIAKKKL